MALTPEEAMRLFGEADAYSGQTRIERPVKRNQTFKKAPFAYPGAKYRSLEYILSELPYRRVWVEAFGGSGVVTMNRERCPLEVYNDRYSGVVDFFRCVRDPVEVRELAGRLEYVLHSREEFEESLEFGDSGVERVERAARWYVTVVQSFGAVGRHWARGLGTQIYDVMGRINGLVEMHARWKNVQVENQDWRDCLKDYDSEDTVFYLDPPYFATNDATYRDRMSHKDHVDLAERIFDCKGFVGLSGYSTSLYMGYPWSRVLKWQIRSPQNVRSGGDGHITECLYIKE